MKPLLSIMVCWLSLTSCHKLLNITKNEDIGIKDVANFYEGYCKYSLGASYSTAKGSAKYFELEVSKSDVLEKFSDLPEMSASNTAYIFYKDLKQESKNYSEIHSVLLFNKKEKYTAVYTIDTLELVSSKMAVLKKVVDLIKIKNFEGLTPLLSDSAYTEDSKKDLILNIKKLEQRFGNAKGFELYGFRFETLKGFNVLNILGAIDRDNQNTEFSLMVDLKPSEDKVFFLDYKFPEK